MKERVEISKGNKAKGEVIYNNKIYPITTREVKNSSGAGDAFLSGLVNGYLKTQNLEGSIRDAQACAAQVVSTITIGLQHD